MAESLAVKYRPKDWSEVCSQNTIVKVLAQQIATETFKNAYIFSGASGSGKTTVARIFANKINKGQGTPIEIDAASHNGIESVRALIEDAYERSIDSEYKIFIIDECHAISTQGWQAFLKCIEEPPRFSIFIFCTTELQKVPETIKNRCQRYSFGKIALDIIRNRLAYICQQEGYTNYEQGISYIAKLADGGMRTAISYLEKCASNSKSIDVSNVMESLEHFQYDLFFRLTDLIFTKQMSGVLKAIEYFYNDGKDIKTFVDQYLDFVLDLTKYSIFGSCELTGIPNILENKMREICAYENATNKLTTYMDKLLELKNMLKLDNTPKTTVEVMFVQLCRI